MREPHALLDLADDSSLQHVINVFVDSFILNWRLPSRPALDWLSIASVNFVGDYIGQEVPVVLPAGHSSVCFITKSLA